MNKFMSALLINQTGKVYPVIPRLRIENFNLAMLEPQTIEYQTEYLAKLTYVKRVTVSSLVEFQEKHIKEQLAREISWQLYGDCERLIQYLYHAIHQDDKLQAIEILDELAKEIKG